MIKLYDYHRSTASYRVRIALEYKHLRYDTLQLHLANGEQFTDEFQALNPQQLVPVLELDGVVLTQSIALLEYLEEVHPQPALLPKGAEDRAQVRALAQLIACDIHPLNNLRVLKYLKSEFGQSQEDKITWYHHWLEVGFTALEQRLQTTAGKCCFGDEISMADICLVPQVYNAKRFEFDMKNFPTIKRINEYCLTLSYFSDVHPERFS